MGDDYIPLDEAAQRSGLHENTLRRLLREGILRGYKTRESGRQRWMVLVASLREYTHPFHGFLLELPGPKLFLRRRDEAEEADEE